MELKDKIVVVTGVSRGIGRAICSELASYGARIIAVARDKKRLEDTQAQLGTHSIIIRADVASEEDINKVVRSALDEFGRIDIWINNAGIAVKKKLNETSLEEFENIMDTNVKGVFLGMKAAMDNIHDGIIINISSGAGRHGIPGISVYSASKFAVNGLTEAAAGETDIKIIALCPGGVDTEMHRSLFGVSPSTRPEDIAREVRKIIEDSENISTGSCL